MALDVVKGWPSSVSDAPATFEPARAGERVLNLHGCALLKHDPAGEMKGNEDDGVVAALLDLKVFDDADFQPADAHVIAHAQAADVVGELERGDAGLVGLDQPRDAFDADDHEDDQGDGDDDEEAGFEGVSVLIHS